MVSSSVNVHTKNNPLNPSIFWEVLQVIFVGIVASYGLFSRKNDELDGESESENPPKFENVQSYLSRFLHVSSFFDEVDNGGQCEFNDDDHVKKMETWSSKYVRNEPMVVVAEKSCVLDDNNHGFSCEKPLLLPVRSLKSRVSDEKDCDYVSKRDYGGSRVYIRSNSSPIVKGMSHNSELLGKNGVIELIDREDLGLGRSNSSLSENRFTSRKSDSKGVGRNGSVKARVEDSSEPGVVDDDMKVSRLMSRSNSNVRSRGFSRKSVSGDNWVLDGREISEYEEKVEESNVLSSPIPWRSRSGRMEMNGESDDSSAHSLSPSLEESEAARLLKPRFSHSNSSSSTPSGSPPRNENKPSEMRSKQVKLTRTENSDTRAVGYNPMSTASFSEYQKESSDFLAHELPETDDESESNVEHYREERIETFNGGETPSDNVNVEESDVDKNVDKKADAFIAKFREQIRLQRIESIKVSNGQLDRSFGR